MPDATQSTSTAQGTSGAALVRKIVCRIYGVLAVLLGITVLVLGAFAIRGPKHGPAAVPAIYGPYTVVFSLIIVVLGVLIFRQRVVAAIALLGVIVVGDVLSYVVPALNLDGVPNFDLADAILGAIVLILTAIVVIADRAARRVKA